MNGTEEIDKILSGESDEALEAHLSIVNLQKNQDEVLLTGHECLDKMLIGGLNNKMVFIGSRPSMGKTHHCQATVNNLLDPKVNPSAASIELLRVNLEMTTQALMLRELKIALKKTMSAIISTPYSESEQEIVKQVVKRFQDKRVINFSRAVKGHELRYTISKFLENANAKEKAKSEKLGKPVKIRKVILVDHLHIYSGKDAIDEVLTICNEFKLSDSNLSFIFYFQLNRAAEEMWRESKEKKINPKNMLPHSGHIYLTDTLMQYADIVMGMVIPQVMDLDEFVAVYKARNFHLKQHFVPTTDSGDKTFVRLKGRNRIYYNFIKIRGVDSFEDPRLYCDILNPELEDRYDQLVSPEKTIQNSTSDSSAPIFGQSHMTPAILGAKGGEFENTPLSSSSSLLSSVDPSIEEDEEDDDFIAPF